MRRLHQEFSQSARVDMDHVEGSTEADGAGMSKQRRPG